jgi:peptidoglycan/LPS O-acetylase OafA/YrhL
MRGLAALFVFFYHFSYSSHDVLTAYGGTGKPDEHREFLKLPFIRFIYTGPAMVSIFYVVSGYALSYKPVKLMRNKSWKDLLHTLSSATFRRALRLYLPCFVSTLMIVLLVRLGAYDATRDIAYDETRLNQVREFHLARYESLWQQLTDWAHMMWIFVHPWSFGTKDTDIDIDKHLWTIP